jgi:alanyl-tRNA synthetase
MMADAYPELAEHRETIIRWVGDEEVAFGRTLDRGTQLLAGLVTDAKDQGTSWVDAADAFMLHDTYGFPYDLTKELLAEEGLSVDDSGFEALMEKQRLGRGAGGGIRTGTATWRDLVRLGGAGVHGSWATTLHAETAVSPPGSWTGTARHRGLAKLERAPLSRGRGLVPTPA